MWDVAIAGCVHTLCCLRAAEPSQVYQLQTLTPTDTHTAKGAALRLCIGGGGPCAKGWECMACISG